MKLWLECSVSGAGQRFSGSLSQAIAKAREVIRFPQIGGATSIWTVDPQDGGNKMIAKVWGDHTWVASQYLHLLYKETAQ